ncbi:MAG: transposase [Solirubrobacterales bacterium]
MPPTKPPYPPEFRREAVQLAQSTERSIAQVARDLGVSDQTLRNWINQADVDAGRREGLTSEEREELRRLRRENRTLLQEREILKKAAAFFARESEGR